MRRTEGDSTVRTARKHDNGNLHRSALRKTRWNPTPEITHFTISAGWTDAGQFPDPVELPTDNTLDCLANIGRV